MKRLIMLALVCLSVVAVAAAPSLAGNSKASAKKTTGDIWFDNTGSARRARALGVQRHRGLAREGQRPLRGHVRLLHRQGHRRVCWANGHDATFTAEVTSSTYLYATIGDKFSWTVHDVAEPGVGSDFFTYLPAGGGSVDLPSSRPATSRSTPNS